MIKTVLTNTHEAGTGPFPNSCTLAGVVEQAIRQCSTIITAIGILHQVCVLHFYLNKVHTLIWYWFTSGGFNKVLQSIFPYILSEAFAIMDFSRVYQKCPKDISLNHNNYLGHQLVLNN